MGTQKGWIAVDLDGTLAEYDKWVDITHVGAPIPKMVERVKAWLKAGVDVRIFTARAGEQLTELQRTAATIAIREWCIEHLGQSLVITAKKDFQMIELWDDRAVQVVPNTGERADDPGAFVGECEENVISKLRLRRDAGRKKYGTSMERTDLNELDWLKHAQEEAMDLAIYLERLIKDKSRILSGKTQASRS